MQQRVHPLNHLPHRALRQRREREALHLRLFQEAQHLRGVHARRAAPHEVRQQRLHPHFEQAADARRPLPHGSLHAVHTCAQAWGLLLRPGML